MIFFKNMKQFFVWSLGCLQKTSLENLFCSENKRNDTRETPDDANSYSYRNSLHIHVSAYPAQFCIKPNSHKVFTTLAKLLESLFNKAIFEQACKCGQRDIQDCHRYMSIIPQAPRIWCYAMLLYIKTTDGLNLRKIGNVLTD